MPKASSLDLRERVVRFGEGGHSCHAAAARFSVSVSFVVRLIKAFRTTGTLAPRPSGGRRPRQAPPRIERFSSPASKKNPTSQCRNFRLNSLRQPARGLILPHSRAGSSATAIASKRCWQPSKIAPQSKRRARNGPPRGSRTCGLSRIVWSLWTRICDLFAPAECQNYFAAAGYEFS